MQTTNNSMVTNKKKICFNNAQVILLIGNIILIGIMVLLINHIYFPGATADELGYLSTPAKLAGWPWKESFQNYPFYGIGVGLFWYPLFCVFDSFITIYKSIIFINTIFLVISSLIAFWCAKNIFKTVNPSVLALASVSITFYPSNLFYAQDALAETLLYLLFWVVCAIILKIIQTNKWLWYLLLALVEAFMLLVHMRSLVLVIATVAFMIFYFLLNKKNIVSFFLLFIPIVSGGLICVKTIQTIYVQNGSNAISLNSVNTNINIFDELVKIFVNIPAFISGVIGEIYGFLVSTNIFILLFVILAAYKCIKVLKGTEKSISAEQFIGFFLLLIFLACLVAFSTNKTVLSRVDSIVYLRYIENIIGPPLLIGMIYASSAFQRKSLFLNRLLIVFIVAVLFGTQIVIRGMEKAELNIFDTSSSVAVGSYFDYYVGNVDNAYTALKIITIIISVACLIYLFLNLRQVKNNSLYAMVGISIMMLTYWGYIDYGAFSKQLVMKEENYNNYNEVLENISHQKESDIYYWEPDIQNSDLKKAKYMQLLLGKVPLNIITPENTTLDKSDSSNIIITDSGDTTIFNNSYILEKDYKHIYAGKIFDMYITE